MNSQFETENRKKKKTNFYWASMNDWMKRRKKSHEIALQYKPMPVYISKYTDIDFVRTFN